MAEIAPGADNNYQVQPSQTFSREVWNAVMASVAARLKARELLEATFETLIANGTQAALDLISQNVAPQLGRLIEQVNALETQLEGIIGGGVAPNALQLGGQNPSYYLNLVNMTGILPVAKVGGVDALIAAAVAGLVNSAPGTLDTLKELSDALGGDANFAANVAALLGAKSAKSSNLSDLLDKDAALVNLQGGAAGIALFKAATEGAARTSLQIDRFNRPRNRIINGDFLVHQRGFSFGDYAGTTGYTADRWVATRAGSTMRATRVESASPAGTTTRMRLTAQAADATPAAGNYASLGQHIEGVYIADAAFGTASAKRLMLRALFKANTAGKIGIAFQNSGSSRSRTTTVEFLPGEVGTDVIKTISVPGDISGTWYNDNRAGLSVWFTIGGGTTYRSPSDDAWHSGNYLVAAGQSNFMATAGATVEIGEVGLYVDHAGDGIVPPYEAPNFAEELHRCRRYFQFVPVSMRGYSSGPGGIIGGSTPISPPMRTMPSIGANVPMPGVNVVYSSLVIDISYPSVSFEHLTYQWTAAAAGDAYALGYGVPLSAEF